MLKNPLGLLGNSNKSNPAPVKNKPTKNKPSQATATIVSPPKKDAEQILAEKYRDAFADKAIVRSEDDSASIENVELLINSAYKQVFGNAYLMESERLGEIESQMRNGQINVSDFIRKLAKSELYRSMFWDKYPNVTAIELNFKHLLGRPPQSYSEIAQHIKILAEGGFEAEIDSYIDSEEYDQNFGLDKVPYLRGYSTQNNRNVVGFTHSFPLFGVACGSDKSMFEGASPKLQTNLIQNNPSSIPPLRPIPDSYPEYLIKGPLPRIPLEIRAMARDLWANVESRRGYRYTYRG